MPTALYDANQAYELDRIAIEEFEQVDLMERAGLALFDHIVKHFAKAEHITIVCGNGNNAGDGYVLARYARFAGHQVQVLYLTSPDELTGSAKHAAQAALDVGIACDAFDAEALDDTDLIVDALLGTGIKGKVKANYSDAIDAINAAYVPVLAVDLPSGLNADTGAINGNAVLAQHTVSFIGLKAGLSTGLGPQHAGELFFAPLSIPSEVYEQVKPKAYLASVGDVAPLESRLAASHKHDMGTVLVIAGSQNMAGAGLMAAMGALRAGSGLVKLATHPDHAATIAVKQPEIMTYGVSSEAALKALLKQATCLVIGPGLSDDKWSQMMLKVALTSELPKILDAGAFDFIIEHKTKLTHAVLTPHAGEAARLLEQTATKIQADRYAAVRTLADQYQASVVLKGSGSIITAPEHPLFVCAHGNAGMASGGFGDVLAGMIGGLVAQGIGAFDAAATATIVHSYVADQLVVQLGQRGLLATDCLQRIGEILG